MKPKFRRSRGRRSGVASLEFALVFPLYAIVVVAVLVGGIRIYQTQQFAAMAKFLARKAIVHGEAADKLGPWGPQTISGYFGDGTAVGNLMASKFNNGQPLDVYYRLNWPDGGNSGLRGDRVEVIISSSSLAGLGASTSTPTGGSSSGIFTVSTSVMMSIAH